MTLLLLVGGWMGVKAVLRNCFAQLKKKEQNNRAGGIHQN
jgi:hypothetical protein